MDVASKLGPFRYSGWMAAVASLGLLLHNIPKVSAAEQQRGVWVLLPQNCGPDIGLVYDNRDIVVSVETSNERLISGTRFSESDLLSKMREIFQTRNSKHIFLVGDTQVDFGLIARTVAGLKAEVPDLKSSC